MGESLVGASVSAAYDDGRAAGSEQHGARARAPFYLYRSRTQISIALAKAPAIVTDLSQVVSR